MRSTNSLVRRGRILRIIGLAALVAVVDGCGPVDLDDLLDSVTTWTRHTIDDSRDGADGVRLGDVNGDGRPDLVTAWEEQGEVVVYLNPGPTLVSAFWPRVRVGSVGSVEDAFFVDLDADGALDVVSSSEGERVLSVHWAPRDPDQLLNPLAWATAEIPASRGQMRWLFAAAGQIDDTHGVDLVAGGKDGAVGWLRAPADARDLAAWTWIPLRNAGWIMSLTVTDLDGDGDQDIVGSDRKGARRGGFWLENPGGAATVTGGWANHTFGPVTEDVLFMDLGDSDGDGDEDLALATWDRGLLLYLRQGVEAQDWRDVRIALPRSIGRGKGVALGDIDLDGRVDAVYSAEEADDRTGVAWLPVERMLAGEVLGPRSVSGDAGSKFDLVQLIDLDDDGDLDVLTTEESAGLGLVWYENPAR